MTDSAMTHLVNPVQPENWDDPYPDYRRLRDAVRVYRSESMGFWALTRFDDVLSAALDAATFSSDWQGVTADDTQGYERQEPLSILNLDPPRHDDLRRLLSRGFTNRRISLMEPAVRAITTELLDAVQEKGSFDFVQDLAAPLPTIVIADLLGIPREDRAQFREWSDDFVRTNPDVDDPVERNELAQKARGKLYEYFKGIVEERRKRPTDDDMVGVLMQAEEGDQRLTEHELLTFCTLLLVAGNETTTNLISNGAGLLERHPQQREMLLQDRSLIPNAIEEILRYDPPVQSLPRILTRDVELFDVKLRHGDMIFLLWACANRDERAFQDPETFDITRKVERHLSFGYGIHYCLGANLARLEARVVFEELFKRFPDTEVDVNRGRRTASGPVRGYVELPARTR